MSVAFIECKNCEDHLYLTDYPETAALVAERDNLKRANDLLQRQVCDFANTRPALIAERDALREALEKISERHIGDQPASDAGDELSWAQRQYAELRRIAPDDRIHKAPPSEDRGNIRSAAPMGFARAVFLANARDIRVAVFTPPAACPTCNGKSPQFCSDCMNGTLSLTTAPGVAFTLDRPTPALTPHDGSGT